jgi:hypothetical protein
MTTFDPNSITPSDDFMRGLISRTNYRDACVLSARWGAEQAVKALKHQWPEPLTRPVTKADADKHGMVQVLHDGWWSRRAWYAISDLPWLHTPRWEPSPTTRLEALNILEDSIGNTRRDGWAEISPDNVRKLREALLSIPGEVLQVPHIHDGNIEYTWKE